MPATNGNDGDQSRCILNPFDPERLRIHQSTIKVREHVTRIAVRKPAPEWWFQTHHDDEFRLVTTILELREGDREILLVDPDLVDMIEDEPCLSQRMLLTCITRQCTVFIWPLKLPDIDNRLDSWNRSALEVAEAAVGSWTRVHADVEAGSYKYKTQQADIPPPQWPELSFEAILRTAFRDHYISSLDHPILRKLRGES